MAVLFLLIGAGALGGKDGLAILLSILILPLCALVLTALM